MRRSASEIINNLESRIARLESKQASVKQLTAVLKVDGVETTIRGMNAISKAIKAHGLDTAIYSNWPHYVRFTHDHDPLRSYRGPELVVYDRFLLLEMGLRRLGGRNIKIYKQS